MCQIHEKEAQLFRKTPQWTATCKLKMRVRKIIIGDLLICWCRMIGFRKFRNLNFLNFPPYML